MIEQIRHMLGPINNRLRNLVLRGTLGLLKTSDGRVSGQFVTMERPIEGVEWLRPFGYVANPTGTLEAVALSVNGAPDHLIVVAAGNNLNVALQPGEVGLATEAGVQIILKADGSILLKGDVRIEGRLEVTGAISDHAGSLDEIRTTHANHVHADPVSGFTSTPTEGT